MQVIVKGRNIDVTNALRKYTLDKISKVVKYFDQILKVEVEFTVEKNPSISESETVEVTVFTKGPVIRAKESSADMYASVDVVIEKLERQVKRYKGKLQMRVPRNPELKRENFMAGEITEESEEHENTKKPRIVKIKQFAIKPMSPEEATLQMELLGHDFYVFTNAETDEINVVYRRKDNNYGLIEPIGRI